MDERVFFAAAADYSRETVDAAVERLFQQLPAASLLAPGKKVLLKPNLLSGTAPEKAVTTHPAVVAAVIRAAKRRGVAAQDITVADSPGGPHASGLVKSAWKASGIAAVCAEEGVSLYTGTASGKAPKAEGAKRRFTLLEPVLAADVIIDLPKCKTHMMTGLSAATKNLFGCIPGLQKAEWHMRCPKKEDFGDMLIDLLLTVKPAFAVLDGVVGHEGNGPSGGSPRPLGFVAAAENLLSMDLALCVMLGLAPESVPYLAAAQRRGLCPAAFDPALAAGETALFAPVDNFRLPDSWRKMNFSDSAPRAVRWAVPAVEKWVAPRPKIAPARCIGCGRCAEICPQHTIEVKNKKAHIKPKDCIRCFCCHEVCPVQAIDTKRFFLFKKL